MRYLSDEWFQAAGELVHNDLDLASLELGEPVAIGYHVTGGPGGERRWRVLIDRGGARIDLAARPTDIKFVQSWDTAVAIARGLQNAQAAFLAGSVRVEGDRQILVRHAAALATLGKVLSPLTDRIEW